MPKCDCTVESRVEIEYVMTVAGSAPSSSVAIATKNGSRMGAVSERAMKKELAINCGGCSFTSVTSIVSTV